MFFNISEFNVSGNLTGRVTVQVSQGVSDGVNYVSNIFKSTFKGESGESKSRKESLDSNTENREAGSKKGQFIKWSKINSNKFFFKDSKYQYLFYSMK